MRSVLFLLVVAALCGVVLSGRSRRLKMHSFQNSVVKISPTGGRMNATTRIFGGSTAPEGRFPYMVFFLYSPKQDFYQGVTSCSAALLSPDWVLLAAHCFLDEGMPSIDGIILVAGKADLSGYVPFRFTVPFEQAVNEQELGLQERRAVQVLLHPSYTITDKTHDVALVRLKTPFTLSDKVATLPLARGTMRSRMMCTIGGWGRSEGNDRTYRLLYADNVYAKTVAEGCRHKAEGNFICLEKSPSGICQGDSGSPLVCGGSIWGVASHLVSYEDNPDCGDDMEEYYAELAPELDWLDKQLQSKFVNGSPPLPEAPRDDTGPAARPLAAVPPLLVLVALLKHAIF